MHAAERHTDGKSVSVTERLYSPGTAETTKSGTLMRPKGSAAAVVRPVSRATDGFLPTVAGIVARSTVACRGATPMGGRVDTPANNQRLIILVQHVTRSQICMWPCKLGKAFTRTVLPQPASVQCSGLKHLKTWSACPYIIKNTAN